MTCSLRSINATHKSGEKRCISSSWSVLDLVLERNVRNMPDIHGRILGRVVMEAGFSGDRTQNTAKSWYEDTQ